MKILVCALTSNDGPRLRRLIASVNRNKGYESEVHGVVSCNTLSETYPAQAAAIASEFGWAFHQSESNGMPGKGKNGALQHFGEEWPDFDYLILMDGDDFLYPTAIAQIERVINRTSCDMMGLQTNDILDKLFYPNTNKIDLEFPTGRVHLYSWFDKQYNIYGLPDQYHKVVRTDKLGKHSTPDRIILFSHKAASVLRCSEKLPVYEDYILSLHAQAEYIVGNLNYVNTSSNCIYVYDKTGETSTCKEYNKKVNGDWSSHDELFKEEIQALEPTLCDFHAAEVPFVFIPAFGQDAPNLKAEYIFEMMLQYPA
jgi:hypothetical protein